MSIPNHVAIILDGNGRWAKKRGMPRNYGHAQGAKNVEVICRAAHNMGIKYLTFYAFSTENWNRPKDEVDALMKLLHNYMKTCLKTAGKNNMRVRVIGDRTRLDEATQKRIVQLEEASKQFDGLNMTIAINSYLDTCDLPYPDLLIRTSGEQRLSNYLLWQLAYSEFYFTDVPWPDFKEKDLQLAVEAYQKRDRRFGEVKED